MSSHTDLRESESQSAPGQPPPLPLAVRRARMTLYWQFAIGGAAMAFGVVVLLPFLVDTMTGKMVLDASGGVAAAALLLAAPATAGSLVLALLIGSGRPGVRTAIIVFESLVIGLQVLNLARILAEGPSLSRVSFPIVGIGLAFSVLVSITRDEARSWFQQG